MIKSLFETTFSSVEKKQNKRHSFPRPVYLQSACIGSYYRPTSVSTYQSRLREWVGTSDRNVRMTFGLGSRRHELLMAKRRGYDRRWRRVPSVRQTRLLARPTCWGSRRSWRRRPPSWSGRRGSSGTAAAAAAAAPAGRPTLEVTRCFRRRAGNLCVCVPTARIHAALATLIQSACFSFPCVG